ncbi:MAG: urease accessory protein UreD, partial [Dehalococcoidia bacterium]
MATTTDCLAADAIGARSLRGRLRLSFSGAGHHTALSACERTPPFHVQRPLFLDRAHPALAHVALLNTTAGLFAGDRLDLRVCLTDRAAVALTTPAMTRAFGMPNGHAEVTTQIAVAAGSYLEFLPEATILCRDAALHQRMELDAESGAFVALGEVFAFGRRAHGEGHAYRELVQRTTLRHAGELVLAEGLTLTPERHADAAGVLGPYAAYGSLQLLTADAGCQALLTDVRSLLAREPRILSAASLLPS